MKRRDWFAPAVEWGIVAACLAASIVGVAVLVWVIR